MQTVAKSASLTCETWIIFITYSDKKWDKEYLNKIQKENEEKLIKSKSCGISYRKSMPKLSFKNDDFDKNYHFKESTYETENTEV